MTEHEHTPDSTSKEPPRISHASATRTLLSMASQGTLSTLDGESGHPYGSIVELATDADGCPVFLLSDLASHTKNFRADPRASLCVTDPTAGPRPLALQRATLVGEIELLENPEALRGAYLEEHPNAQNYVDFDDFNFWRLCVDRVRYIGGFGRMSWFEADRYKDATVDPLADSAQGVIEHMNDDHADALVDYAVGLADIEDTEFAKMVGVDHLGFDMEVHTASGLQQIRIPFEPLLESADEVRHAMVELVRKARA